MNLLENVRHRLRCIWLRVESCYTPLRSSDHVVIAPHETTLVEAVTILRLTILEVSNLAHPSRYDLQHTPVSAFEECITLASSSVVQEPKQVIAVPNSAGGFRRS
jgi:hypothetical protein